MGNALGGTAEFDDDTLATLYDSDADYLDQFIESASTAVDSGFLLAEDAAAMIARATAATLNLGP